MASSRWSVFWFALVAACAGARPSETARTTAPGAGLTTPPAAAPAPSADAPALARVESFVSDEPIAPVKARFEVPPFVRPKFPARVFDIKSYGAVEGGTAKATGAFEIAIEAAASQGGGTVLVPAGRWLTGPIHLKSNVNLHLAEGSVVLFSQDFADYLPPVFTRWEGLEVMNYSPLIYAKDCENVAVTGSGKLDGQGQAWWPWKKTQKASAERLYKLASTGAPPEARVFGVEGGLRPSFIQTVGCKNVLIEGITITSGPMWTIHPVYSENVIVRRVTVTTDGPNNDGCNPDSSKNVLVEESFFSTGDDCVVIKSGLNEDGWRVGRPSENIVVRRLKGERGHGGVVIGSEMSGGVRNVHVEDCEFTGTDRGLRIKSMRGRGGVIENISYENVRHENLRLFDVEMTTFYASSTLVPLTQKPPQIKNVLVKNLTGTGAKTAIEIVGLPELPVEGVTFEHVTLASDQGVRCTDCRNVRFSSSAVTRKSGPAFRLENVESVAIDGTCKAGDKICVELVGKKSSKVTIDGSSPM
jgi:polygalacturonase